MSGLGITGYGAYIPRLRLDRRFVAEAHKWMAPSLKSAAKGSRAFCSWDEDAITMAVEAARDALGQSDRTKIESVTLASTTLPYADLQNSSIVAGALRFRPDIRAFDVAHSQRAGTSALIQALKSSERAIVIASEKPNGKPGSTQEIAMGAGAAALTLGDEGVIARCLGTASVTVPFVDHFRPAGGDHDYVWEERWVREEGYLKLAPRAANAALASANVKAADIAHFVLPSLVNGASAAVAKKVGVTVAPSPGLEDGCGYAGAAHGLLMLCDVLERAKPGEKILLVSFGQGADALVLEVTEAIRNSKPRRGVSGSLAEGIATDSYLRMLSFAGGINLEWGMRAERDAKTALTEQYRNADQMAAFVAGKCKRCGTAQFPQLEYCVNPKCQAPAREFEQISLVEEPGQVLTYTADWLSYYPAPPLYVGFVQFKNGARVLMEVADVGPEGLEVGQKLRMVFRIKEQDKIRQFDRYFWKATPLAKSGDA